MKLIASEMKPFICTCHLDGVVRKWDMITGACLGEWHGHCAGILDMVLTRYLSHVIFAKSQYFITFN